MSDDRSRAEEFFLKGIACLDNGDFSEAEKHFLETRKLAPAHVATLNNLSIAQLKQGRVEAAINTVRDVLAIEPQNFDSCMTLGNLCGELNRQDDAFAAYDKAVSIDPRSELGWLGRGNACAMLKHFDEALASYQNALAIDAGLAGAWLGRGNVFSDLENYDEAIRSYEKAVALDRDLAFAWLGQGNAFAALRRFEEAFVAYDRAFALDTDTFTVEGSRLLSKMYSCDWTNFEAEQRNLIQSVRAGKVNSPPFAFLGVSDSAQDQFVCSRLWAMKRFPPSGNPLWRGETYKHDRIRVAYVSADFRNHAVSYLLAGVFEKHDKTRFETVAISFGSDDKSDVRARLVKSFDNFIDVTYKSDADIARLLRREEIDIVVDLMGFTAGSRTNIFAHRPAPIQVNFLGYPGTLGTASMDYLIADPTLIPESQQGFYAEKIAYLPHSYMPNDDAHRTISASGFERAEFGLPRDGFVFCCFNNPYKLNPATFSKWMNILKAVEGSVLWLPSMSTAATDRLKARAAEAGVNPKRLIFSQQMPLMPDHLARLRLADLFLDTLPYNAHTTASDALWAGVPVLTQIGETFAGRVAASLLNALGMPELIARTGEEYEALAIRLASNPQDLRTINEKLRRNRLAMPLFSTQLFTDHLERLYQAMHDRYQKGLPPGHIHLADQ